MSEVAAKYQKIVGLLEAAVNGKTVQTRYAGEWTDLNLEGLVRRMITNPNFNEYRIKPRAPITKGDARDALANLKRYTSFEGVADSLNTLEEFIERR